MAANRRDSTRHDVVVSWPSLMSVQRATAYAGVSRHVIDRAVKLGRLAVAGQRGNRKVFSRTALDAFLIGETTRGPVPISASLRQLAAASRKARR